MGISGVAGKGPQHRSAICALVLALVALAPAAPAQDPAVIGQWDPLIFVPAVPVHSILLYTNKILMFRGDGNDDIADVPTSYVLDLETFQITSQDPLGNNVFCIGHSQLPDGRIWMTGGTISGTSTGPIYTHIFDPVTELWTPGPDMRNGRYYPTNTAMGDGTTLVFSGTMPNDSKNPEVERLIVGGGPGGTDLLEYMQNADETHSEYPRNHLLPDGRIVVVGTRQETKVLDPVTQVWTEIAESNFGKRSHGTSVMLPPTFTRIMIIGGRDSGATVSTETAEIIDMSDPTPTWTYANPMHHRRMHANVVILPDMQILVSGGSESPGEEDPVYVSEMFDPVTETWTEVAVQNSFRLYHSSANLLPDGRVIWGGGNGNETIEIYSPPYLFQGPRPVITTSPVSVGYGESFVVETPDAANIATAVFMRPGATTHSIDMEQRYVGLDFVQGAGEGAGSIVVTAPSEPNIAPPGYYMLFLLDGNGIPSEAPFVQLGGQVALQVSAGFEQTITLPDVAVLDGTVVSNDPATTLWEKVSGPGSVTFGDATAMDTTAAFSEAGTYVLSLTADDGSTVISDTVVVIVFEPGSMFSVDEQVIAFFDDAEEAPDGTVDLGSSDIELVNDGGAQTVGLRFNNITIPQGAQITQAEITFQVDETSTVATDLTIEGHAVDTAPPFTDSVSQNVSSRARTAANVSWMPAPWTVIGSQQTTSDLTPVVQELVDRPGWQSGNSIAFIFTGTGERVAEAVDSNPNGSARVHIEYTNSPANDPPVVSAGHNQVVTLPAVADLDASVNDEEPSALVTTWSLFSGPGGVTFGDPSSVDTTASFGRPGTYVLKLTADDGEFVSFDQVMVIVNSATPNSPPVVAAGLDVSANLRTAVSLDGAVQDDSDALSITWSRASGPGRVDFDDPHAASTTARFFKAGTYVLRLTAQDRQFTVADEITVSVGPAAPSSTPGLAGQR